MSDFLGESNRRQFAVRILQLAGLPFLPRAVMAALGAAGEQIALASPTAYDSLEVFGTRFRWRGESDSTSAWLRAEIEERCRRYSLSFDPDGFYNPQNLGPASKSSQVETARIESASEQARQETGGIFDVRVRRDGRILRDFGGICQGFVLEELARTAPGPWVGDFAGDLFLSPGSRPLKAPEVMDPLFKGAPYASVEMKAGWILGSSGALETLKMRDPRSEQRSRNEDFQKIVLFAKPNFNGARLDAWSTALIVGGKELLAHLQSLRPYQGEWAHLAFDSEGRVSVSENVRLVRGPLGRTVQLPW